MKYVMLETNASSTMNTWLLEYPLSGWTVHTFNTIMRYGETLYIVLFSRKEA